MNDLLNEKWIEALPKDTINIYQELNNEIAQIIVNRINEIGKLKASEGIKLANAYKFFGADFDKIEKAIQKATKLSNKEIDVLFEKLADSNNRFARVYYEARGMTPKTHLNDDFIGLIVSTVKEQTKGRFYNLSNTLAYSNMPLRQAYVSAIDKAIYEVKSGTIDYTTAMRKTIINFGSGADYVYYDTIVGYDRLGNPIYYHKRLDSAVRQNVLDGVRQLNQRVMEYNGKQFQSDGVELSAHFMSAPDHAPAQGHQFDNVNFNLMQSGADFEDYQGKKYIGFLRPIGEWNCKHFALPIVLGVSNQTLTDTELKEYEKNSETKYPLEQKQRSLELQLRKLKGERMALSGSQAKELQRKINDKQRQYKQFCEDNGLLYQPNRATVSGYRAISTR